MDSEVTSLADALRSPTKITEFKKTVDLLKERVGTPRFCEMLSVRPSEGEASGWTTLFKALVVGLTKNRSWRRTDTVDGLKLLIEAAHRTGALLEVAGVEQFLIRTAQQLAPPPAGYEPVDDGEDDAPAKVGGEPEIPAEVVPTYLKVMSVLCSRAEYFRSMAAGRSAGIAAAQAVADQLVGLCVALTAVDEHAAAEESSGVGGGRGATQAKPSRRVAARLNATRPTTPAAKLLGQLVFSFPFALEDKTLASLFRQIERLGELSLGSRGGDSDDASPARGAAGQTAGRASSSAAGTAGGVSSDAAAESDRRRELQQQVKELLPLLLSALNTALRRQGADRLDFVWQQLVCSTGVQDWVSDAMGRSDHPPLLHELVQLCRLVLILARLGRRALPAPVQAGILALAERELAPATALRLADPPDGSFAARLLRGSRAGAVAAADDRDALCLLELVADALLLEQERGAAMESGSPDREAAPKRQRTGRALEALGVPAWLLARSWGADEPAGLGTPAPGWRSLLLLAVCLRRGPRLGASALRTLAALLLPVASRSAEEHERAPAICATLALLALSGHGPGLDGGLGAGDTGVGAPWGEVWRWLWSLEASGLAADAARGSAHGGSRILAGMHAAGGAVANEAALHADLRRELLRALLRSNLAPPAATGAAAAEAARAFVGALRTPAFETPAEGAQPGGGAMGGSAAEGARLVGWTPHSRQALALELWVRHPSVLERLPSGLLASAVALDASPPSAGAHCCRLGLSPCSSASTDDSEEEGGAVALRWLMLRARLLLSAVGVAAPEDAVGHVLSAHGSPPTAAAGGGPTGSGVGLGALAEGQEEETAAAEAEEMFRQLDLLLEALGGNGDAGEPPRVGGGGAAALPQPSQGALGRLSAGAEAAMEEVCSSLAAGLASEAALLTQLQALCLAALVLALTAGDAAAASAAGSRGGGGRERLSGEVVASVARAFRRLSGGSDASAAALVPLLVRLLAASAGEQEAELLSSVVAPRVVAEAHAAVARRAGDAARSASAGADPMGEEDLLGGGAEERGALEAVCDSWLAALAELCAADARGSVFPSALLGSFQAHGSGSVGALLRLTELPQRLPGLCLRLVALPHPSLLARQMELLQEVAEGGPRGSLGRLCGCLDACAALLREALRRRTASAHSSSADRSSPTRAPSLKRAACLLAGCAAVLRMGLGALGDAPLPLAAAAIGAAVEWVRLFRACEGAHGWSAAAAEVQLSDLRPTLVAALPPLLEPQRMTHQADTLRLQVWLLPHLALLGLVERLRVLAPSATAHQPLEVQLAAARTSVAVLGACSAARQRSVLLALCLQCGSLRASEAVLLPVLDAGCRSLGGLRALLELHLAWLIEQWLATRDLLSFPAHWLAPPPPAEWRAVSGGARPPFDDTEARTRLRQLLEAHRSAVVPTLLVAAKAEAEGGRGGGGGARAELERAARLLQLSEAQMLSDSVPHLVGRWLPAKFLPAGQPAAAKWRAVEGLLKEHLKREGGAATLQTLLKSQMDPILQCLVSLERAAWIPEGSPHARLVELLVQALRYLADLAEPGTLPARLLFGVNGRALELVLLLHHRHVAAARAGAPCEAHRESALVLLELMTSSEEVVPAMLRAEGMRHLSLAALARMLQHATLALLDGGGGVVARCVRVLQPLLEAVLGASTAQLADYSAYPHAASQLSDLQREHTSALVYALLPLAPASKPAFQLLDLAVRRLRPADLAMLPPLPAAAPFEALAAMCDRERRQTPLSATLAAFVRLSEREVAGAGLASRLQLLLSSLEAEGAAAELAHALPYAATAGGGVAAASLHPPSLAARQLAATGGSAARRLLSLARAAAGSEAQWLLARCLGALLRSGLPQRALHARNPSASRAEGVLRSDLATVVPRLLLLLHGCLTDSDPRAMLLAADALRESLKPKAIGSEIKEATRELSKRHLLVMVELEAYVRPLPYGHDEALHRSPARDAALRAIAGAEPLSSPSAGQLSELNRSLPALWSARGKGVDAWVCSLAESLLHHARLPLLRHCRRLAASKPALARLCLLPALLDLLEDVRDDARFVGSLARAFSRACNEALRTDPPPPPAERQATEIQLELLIEVRAHAMPQRPTDGWKFGALWAAVDLRRAAHAALAAGAPLTSLQLLEASAEEGSELLPEAVLRDAAASALLLDVLSTLPQPDVTLGVTAAVADAGGGSSQGSGAQGEGLDRLSLLDTLLQVQRSLEPGAADSEATFLKMARTLREMGCDHLYAACTRRAAAGAPQASSLIEETPAVREARAEAAWRLGQWGPGGGGGGGLDGGVRGVPPVAPAEAEAGVHEQLLCALVSLRQGRPAESMGLMRRGASSLVAELGQLGDEGGKRLDELSLALRLCMEVCEVAAAGSRGGAAAAAAAARSLSAQSDEARGVATPLAGRAEYLEVEPVLALRTSMLRLFGNESAPLASALLGWASHARQEGNLPMAAARLSDASALPLSAAEGAWAGWEAAQLLWQAGATQPADRARAAALASALLEDLAPGPQLAGPPAAAGLSVAVCSTLATWRATERTGSTAAAAAERAHASTCALHERAVGLCDGLHGSASAEARCGAHHAFASYLEAQYRSCLAEKSGARERRLETLHRAAREELRGTGGAGRAALASRVAEHEARLVAREGRLLCLARRAFEQHASCARHGELHNHASTFAMLSLWFAHPEGLPHADRDLTSLPLAKLLPLVPQLACRLGGAADEELEGGASGDEELEGGANGARRLQEGLRSVLLHVGGAHVRQVLPHILALALGDHYAPREGVLVADPSQLRAARELEAALQARLAGGGSAGVVEDTERLFLLYLQIAWVDSETTKKVAALVGGVLSLDSLVGVELDARYGTYSTQPGKALYRQMQRDGGGSRAPVLTRDPEAQAEEAAVDVVGFSPPGREGARRAPAGFSTAGGVNLPKIVMCYGSDGKTYQQLVKGRDDGRQDAALQEVFSLVNILLRRDPQTRQRALQLRTYRIVPLAPTAALLQWVDNSMPLLVYLTAPGKGGAHERFRPKDLKTSEARSMMADAYARETKRQKGPHRAETYAQVQTKLRPVLHFFFLERFPLASAWFERRLSYARSLAASSMAGFVVGLGDRHSSNILLDKETAELIHIDLGIAFDQGALLRTPECVPFRLTRDLVDGLGVWGVEGPMRGSAEQTMRVLRANAESLLAILQLVVYNPLYKWAQDEKAMQERTHESRPAHAQLSRNQEAERALSRVQLKLEGREVGRHECLSVEGQVGQLIDQARDPANLSRMFEGWAAWL